MMPETMNDFPAIWGGNVLKDCLEKANMELQIVTVQKLKGHAPENEPSVSAGQVLLVPWADVVAVHCELCLNRANSKVEVVTANIHIEWHLWQ